MKKLLLTATAFIALTGIAQADVMVHDAQAYETAVGGKAGAAFANLHSEDDDRLISATSEVAERVEIHEMLEENGVMKMRRVEGGLALPAHKIVELTSHGYHLMLLGLKAPLKAGTEFPVTLTFEKSKPETVNIKVISRSNDKATPTETHHHDH